MDIILTNSEGIEETYSLQIVFTDTSPEPEPIAKEEPSPNVTASQNLTSANVTNTTSSTPVNETNNTAAANETNDTAAANETEPEEESEEEEEKPPRGKKAAFLNFELDFERKERASKNWTPPPLDEEEEVEEVWVRPIFPPELRAISLGSKGEIGINFNQPVVFPNFFYEKANEDKVRKQKKSEGVVVVRSSRKM